MLIKIQSGLIPLFFFLVTPVRADCLPDPVTRLTDTRIQRQIEGNIRAGDIVATADFPAGTVADCDNRETADIRLQALLPGSDTAPVVYRVINGVPAYYLNSYYAYSLQSHTSQPYTGKGNSVTVKKNGNMLLIPGSTLSVYAVTDNPPSLQTHAVRLGKIRNDRHETLMTLTLSAVIDMTESCTINSRVTPFDFGELDSHRLAGRPGKTAVTVSNPISVSCTRDRSDRNITIKLTNANRYAIPEKSVIASDNPSLGFVLYYKESLMTENTEISLGNMAKNMNPVISASLYKLNDNVIPGPFSGTAEYTIRIN